MIKTKAQLNSAYEKLRELENQLGEIKKVYDGIEQEMFEDSVNSTIEDIENEIIEYRRLTSIELGDAIEEKLIGPTLLEDINELIAKIRISSGISQKELAEKVGWDQPNISRYESDYYNSQTLKGIIELTSAMGVWIHIIPSLSETLLPQDLSAISIETLQKDIEVDPMRDKYSLSFDSGMVRITVTGRDTEFVLTGLEDHEELTQGWFATDSSGFNTEREDLSLCSERMYANEYN